MYMLTCILRNQPIVIELSILHKEFHIGSRHGMQDHKFTLGVYARTHAHVYARVYTTPNAMRDCLSAYTRVPVEWISIQESSSVF
jgi:hypothetical protein